MTGCIDGLILLPSNVIYLGYLCIDGLILLPSNVIYLGYSKWNYCMLSNFIAFFIFIGSL